MVSNEGVKKIKKNSEKIIIRIAILAEEPLRWGSGKHYFPVILNNYSWKINNKIKLYWTRTFRLLLECFQATSALNSLRFIKFRLQLLSIGHCCPI